MIHLIYNIKSFLLKLLLFAFANVIFTISALGIETDSLFQSDDLINIELRSDFSSIQKDRVENPSPHDGELIYYSPDGNNTKFSVKLTVRGNFRRDPENCKFPPLAVNFKKSEVKNTLFKNQDKLDLVTPCQFEEDVIEEYLIYKMYNQVTDLSMKVRLAKISYFDTGKGKMVFERYSFFIEAKEHVADRNNLVRTSKFVTPFDLNSENIKKLSVFQYMIGNKDWFYSSKKNMFIMQSKDSINSIYAVPYDFDFSGLVNAEYTKPKGVPDESLTNRRIYKGVCYSTSELTDIFDFYRKLRPEFESIIKNMDLISKYGRNKDLEYLRQFYSIIDNKDLIMKEFMANCETRKTYNIVEK